MEQATVPDRRWWTRRPSGWPPAELIVAPALIVLILHALTTREALFPNQGDLLLYFEKAQALASGGLPYRDFAFEYPPLALVSMALPYLAWPGGSPDFDIYRWLFTAWQALLLMATAVVSARLAHRLHDDRPAFIRTVGLRLVILSIATAPSLTFRFDLLPALLVALAVMAVLDDRPGWAGVLIGLGALVKVYPLVLAPILVAIWVARGDRTGPVNFVSGLGLTISAVLLPLWVLVGDPLRDFVAYQADRGLQLESVAAGFIMLGSALGGVEVPVEFAFGSVQVAGPAAEAFLSVQTWLVLLAVLALAALAFRATRTGSVIAGQVRAETVIGLALAAITAFLVTNKVLSVQYIVWLIPLAALVGRRRFWLTVVIGLLSIAIHPLFYGALIEQQLAMIVVLCLRNSLLLALLAWLLVDLVRRSSGADVGRKMLASQG